MAEIVRQQISLAGLTPVLAAAAAGDDFKVDDRTFLIVHNGSGAPITVTVDSIKASDYGTDVNPAITVAAGADKFIGPFDPARFRDTDGKCGVSYSSTVTITRAVVRV